MHSVLWYCVNRNLFNNRLQTATVTFGLRTGSVRLFHAVGPAVANARRPNVPSRCRSANALYFAEMHGMYTQCVPLLVKVLNPAALLTHHALQSCVTGRFIFRLLYSALWQVHLVYTLLAGWLWWITTFLLQSRSPVGRPRSSYSRRLNSAATLRLCAEGRWKSGKRFQRSSSQVTPCREEKNAFRYKNSAGLSLFKPPVLSLKTELEDKVSISRCGSKCP